MRNAKYYERQQRNVIVFNYLHTDNEKLKHNVLIRYFQVELEFKKT